MPNDDSDTQTTVAGGVPSWTKPLDEHRYSNVRTHVAIASITMLGRGDCFDWRPPVGRILSVVRIERRVVGILISQATIRAPQPPDIKL